MRKNSTHLDRSTKMVSNKGFDDAGEVVSYSGLGVQRAVYICCVLGHNEIFNYFLSELPIPVNFLTKPIVAELLRNKGISFPFTGNNYVACLRLFGTVMGVNQH